MYTVRVSMPKSMRLFIEEQARIGGYGTPSEFVVDLLRDRQKKQAEDRAAQLVQEALDAPEAEMTSQDWIDMRQTVQDRLAKRK